MQAAQRKFDYDESAYSARKRVVKMQGNVAYINTDPVRPVRKAQPSTQAQPARKTQAKPAAKPRSNAKAAAKAAAMQRERAASRRSLASTLFVIFVAFCALSFMISRYAALCTIGVQNSTIKENIAMIEGEIDKLQLDMELRDIGSIQNIAQNELHMKYPTQDQKITINMSG